MSSDSDCALTNQLYELRASRLIRKEGRWFNNDLLSLNAPPFLSRARSLVR